jgi:hypothetical protein
LWSSIAKSNASTVPWSISVTFRLLWKITYKLNIIVIAITIPPTVAPEMSLTEDAEAFVG